MKNFILLILITTMLSITFAACESRSKAKYDAELAASPQYLNASMSSISADSLSPRGETYISELKGSKSLVSKTPIPEDDNEVVGNIDIGQNTYSVHEGSRGGLYIWRVSGKTGNPYKMSVTKRKEEIY